MSSDTSQSLTPDPAIRPHPAPTPLWILIALVLLCTLPIVVLSATIGNLRDDATDDQMFAYYGWRLLGGATVYLDVWDNKPPGVFWANAAGLWLGGGHYLGVTILCGVMLMAAVISYFVIGLRLFHRDAAALSTIIASFFMTHGWFQAGSNRTETYLVAFELVGMAIYVSAYSRWRWWTWYLAGLMFGGAFVLKQTGLAAWGAAGLHTIMLVVIGRLDWRRGLFQAVMLAAGAATTIAMACGVLAWQGALEAGYHAVFTFNRGYFEVGASQFPFNSSTFYLLRIESTKIIYMPLLVGAVSVIHASLNYFRPALRDPAMNQAGPGAKPAMPGIVFLAVVWYLATVLGAVISPHGFRHYLIPTLSPLMLLFAYLIHQLQGEYSLMQAIQRRAWIALTTVVLTALALVGLNRQWELFSRVWMLRDPVPVQGSWFEWDMQPLWWEAIGQRVAELSDSDETLQCWGYNPGIYFYARRRNSCKYTTVEKISQLTRGNAMSEAGSSPAQAEIDRIVDSIKDSYTTTPPDWYVMTSGHKGSDIKSGDPDKRQDHLYTWTTAWLDENYELVEELVTDNTTAYLYKRRQAGNHPANQEG
jgi:4-amino-4-deoxy-L-arabinose transferase-like glycosyltransferase